MLKLTRLNNHVVAINPDHIRWAEASPDTTLVLLGGERILIRETLDELIAAVVTFRKLVRAGVDTSLETMEGDPPPVSIRPPRGDRSSPSSWRPREER